MTPLERVLSRLPNPRRVRGGYEDRCPAHDDRQASLAISTGEDGRVLLYCHAGCQTPAVVDAMGLTLPDLFPGNSGSWNRPWVTAPPPVTRRLEPPEKVKKVHATPEKAALAYRRGQPDRTWIYRDADGTEIGRVVRWNCSWASKVIRPLAVAPNGWVCGSPPPPRGLYRLPEILADKAAIVWLCEGEKCADWVASLGFLGTTTWGGAKGVQHANLMPLSGRHVVIVPDHNDAGIGYARDCIDLLSGVAAKLQVVPPQCFPWNQDIADLTAEAAMKALKSATDELTLI